MARKNVLTGAKKKKALALAQARQLQEAKELCRQVCTTDPVDAEAWFLLGAVHGLLGELNDAVACSRRATTLDPGHFQAHYNLATALKDLGRMEESVVAYRSALRGKPDYAEAWDGLGYVLMTTGHIDDAIAAYREVLRLQPRNIKALVNLGSGFHLCGRLEEAVSAYREALKLDPFSAVIEDGLSCVLSDQGFHEEAITGFRNVLTRAPGNATAHSNMLLTLHYLPAVEPDALLAEHKRWARMHTGSAAQFMEYGNIRDLERCLRVGYVSADFRAHSVAFFIEPILAQHDNAKVESICYSGVTTPDVVTNRLRSLTREWRDIRRMSDTELTEMIRRDRIDILVDLAGHTAGNRLKVFARRPAPVQVTYLGYPDTTGLEAINYRLTDMFADPQGNDARYTEKLIRLPGCFLCYKPPEDCPPVTPLPAQKRGFVTFGSFNNLSKINSDVIGLWTKLLQEVQGARLFIKNPSFTDKATRERYCGLFGQYGVSRDRIELQGRTATQTEHLALYARVDIALDTFPYNGTTTTCEALWMGVPVVTLAGHAHAGRVGVSLLTAAGLTELIASNKDDYVARAASLANDVNRLSGLREELRARLHASCLCDARGFTRKLEDAYRAMWRRWCSARI